MLLQRIELQFPPCVNERRHEKLAAETDTIVNALTAGLDTDLVALIPEAKLG